MRFTQLRRRSDERRSQKEQSICRANFKFLKSLSNCWKTTLGTGPDMEITETHCQLLGFISGRVTVALTCNPDYWDAPHENEDVSIESCSLRNQTNNLAQTVGIGTSCPTDWQLTIRSRLRSAFTFRHLCAQSIWQRCCILRLCRARHRSFSWPHK